MLITSITPKRALPHGIYVPTVTFFSADKSGGIDTETTTKHALFLAEAGVTGIVVCGTYGEGVLTTPKERVELITTVRSAFDRNGFKALPVFAGCSDNSVQAVISNAIDAANAGADAILCTPPSYYKPMMNDEYLVDFYTTLADNSPLPVLLYNYPAVTAGIDISSEVMIKLGKHPNIIGAKYTCANVGKLTRVVHALEASGVNKSQPFLAFAGLCDVLVPSLAVGGAGAIAGPANIVPKTVIQVYNLFKAGKYDEANEAQRSLAHLDNDFMSLGIEGVKIYLQKMLDAPEHVTQVRCPKKVLSQAQKEDMISLVDKYVAIEKGL